MRKVNARWLGKCAVCGKPIQGALVICWGCWYEQDAHNFDLSASLCEVARG